MTNTGENSEPEDDDSASKPYQVVADQNLESSDNSPPKPSVTATLRWWPAVVLLVTMALVRMLPKMFESPELPVMMIGFMGPATIGLLLMVWFCFFSRATLKEKLVGTTAMAVISVVCVALLHMTLAGMFAVVLVIPTGLAAFAIGLVVMSRKPQWRLPVALTMSLLAYGYWDLQQNEGTTGAFKSQLLWRWEQTAEQRYLSELADRDQVRSVSLDSTPLDLESAEWPAFRGEDRNGVVSGVSLASDWDQNPPELIWKRKIGPGWSSISVAGTRIYTQEQRGEQEAVVCLDADTGNQIWEFTYPGRFWEAIAGAGPRATPTLAKEGVFALGAEGMLVRLDAATGKEIWHRDLKADASREPPTWGFSASPLVIHSLVIVHAGGKGDKGLIAYDAESGEIKWTAASGDHSYSSAQLATFADQRGVLMLANDGLQYLDIGDGKQIWAHPWEFFNYRVLQPMVVGQSVYFMTSMNEGLRRLTINFGEDGDWNASEDWTTKNLKADYNDCVYYQGNIYGFDGGVFACIDAETGDRRWKRGRYGNGQVIVLVDSGQLLVLSEKGELVLIDASPEKLLERGKFQAIEGKTWNHPVLIGNRLYIRNAQEVACYQMKLAD
ncbi:MAG: PQQ-like beta-propeller repeat protein [Planctomycetales bacterium]|nr:PQQ-like beta-propeller repeat protein [Planctomycetales bacterium]